jgi:hypothetical protein
MTKLRGSIFLLKKMECPDNFKLLKLSEIEDAIMFNYAYLYKGCYYKKIKN